MNPMVRKWYELRLDRINRKIADYSTLYRGRIARLNDCYNTGDFEVAAEVLEKHEALVLKQNRLVEILKGDQNAN